MADGGRTNKNNHGFFTHAQVPVNAINIPSSFSFKRGFASKKALPNSLVVALI